MHPVNNNNKCDDAIQECRNIESQRFLRFDKCTATKNRPCKINVYNKRIWHMNATVLGIAESHCHNSTIQLEAKSA